MVSVEMPMPELKWMRKTNVTERNPWQQLKRRSNFREIDSNNQALKSPKRRNSNRTDLCFVWQVTTDNIIAWNEFFCLTEATALDPPLLVPSK